MQAGQAAQRSAAHDRQAGRAGQGASQARCTLAYVPPAPIVLRIDAYVLYDSYDSYDAYDCTM